MEQASAHMGDLALVIIRLVHGLREESSGTGLSPAAVSTLRRLADEGPLRLTDLAKRENASQPAMTQLIRRLAGAGLIGRDAAPDDGRVVILSITADGAALLERRLASQEGALERSLDGLSAADREDIIAAIPALRRLASGIQAVPPR